MTLSPINDRIFYACQAVYTRSRYTTTTGGNDSISSPTMDFLKGVQSIGVSREVNKTNLVDYGRFQQEYGYYGLTEFTINVSRLIHKAGDFFFNVSGQSVYEDAHILNSTNGIGFSGATNALKNFDILLIYTQDTRSYVQSGSGGPSDAGTASAVIYRCCLLKSISYEINVDGSITENLTFTTNIYDKVSSTALDQFPDNSVDSEETVRRADIITSSCVFPVEVTRMFDLSNSLDGIPILGLQSININIEISYADLADYGKWPGSAIRGVASESLDDRAQQNRFKEVSEVTVDCTFEGIVRDRYALVVDEYNATDVFGTVADGDDTVANQIDVYTSDREIKIIAETDGSDLFQWHLGAKNFVTGVDFSGGDAGGGNVEGSISFSNVHREIFLIKDSTIRNFSPSSIY